VVWGRAGQIGPIGRDQRFTAVRQDQNEKQSTVAMDRPQNRERLTVERMTGTGNRDFLREVLMMGSVTWFPSIGLTTTN
jgi:hypothetical protein